MQAYAHCSLTVKWYSAFRCFRTAVHSYSLQTSVWIVSTKPYIGFSSAPCYFCSSTAGFWHHEVVNTLQVHRVQTITEDNPIILQIFSFVAVQNDCPYCSPCCLSVAEGMTKESFSSYVLLQETELITKCWWSSSPTPWEVESSDFGSSYCPDPLSLSLLVELDALCLAMFLLSMSRSCRNAPPTPLSYP